MKKIWIILTIVVLFLSSCSLLKEESKQINNEKEKTSIFNVEIDKDCLSLTWYVEEKQDLMLNNWKENIEKNKILNLKCETYLQNKEKEKEYNEKKESFKKEVDNEIWKIENLKNKTKKEKLFYKRLLELKKELSNNEFVVTNTTTILNFVLNNEKEKLDDFSKIFELKIKKIILNCEKKYKNEPGKRVKCKDNKIIPLLKKHDEKILNDLYNK